MQQCPSAFEFNERFLVVNNLINHPLPNYHELCLLTFLLACTLTHTLTHSHTHTHTLTSLTLTQSVVEHSYSGMFGTFITDSEKEQKQVEILILCTNLVKIVA